MQKIIEQSILLRRSEAYDESRELLSTLFANPEHKAIAHLYTAFTFDNEGKETEAVFHYETALAGKLSSSDRFEGLLGLASTLRSLGRYKDAIFYFEKLSLGYPNALEYQPFYAMCLYNLGEHKKATSLLLDLLIDTTNSEAIKEYHKAIRLYSSDLDRKW